MPRPLRDVLCLGFALLLFAGATRAAPYRFEDNVAEFLAAGQRALEQGDLEGARIELENVLLISPGNSEGHELLVDAYHRLGLPRLARRTLDRIVTGRLLPPARVQALRARLGGGRGDAGEPGRGSFWDGPPPALPPPGAASPERAGIPSATEVAVTEIGLSGEGLDAMLEELEILDEPPSPRPDPTPAGEGGGASPGGTEGGPAPDGSDPRATFMYAVSLFKRTHSVSRAGPLFVNAIDAAPELLAEPDGGLLDATYRTYQDQVERAPDSVESRFVLAVLEERRGEEKRAIEHWRRIADKAPPGSRMARVGAARSMLLEDELEARERERQALLERLERERLEKLLPEIAKGNHPDVKDPAEYEERGLEYYQEWQSGKDQEQLRLARAWLAGAAAREPGNPEYHYRYALVRVDEATEGVGDVDAARAEARAALKRTLALDPPPQIRLDAENLLSSLPGGDSSGTVSSGPADPGARAGGAPATGGGFGNR